MEFRRGKEAPEVDVIEEGLVFFHTSSPVRRCKICLEEEEIEMERISTAMEAPCACSGTLKFAHRKCIQRWCDEKGSTLCEICLQIFRPGYTASSKREVLDVGVAIRGNVTVLGRVSHDSPSSGFSAIPWDEETNGLTNQSDAVLIPGRIAKCSRSIAMTFTTVLLVKNFISVMSLGAQYHVSTLCVLFGLRATGVLLPVILILKSITAIQNLQSKHRHRRLHENELFPLLPELQDGGPDARHHVVQVNC